MVYKFDPAYWNGTIFEFREWDPSCDLDDYRVHNKPIPAHCFPKSLTLIAASRVLPDIFHTYRNIIVFSERARVFMEERVPGQVEFIPVVLKASPKLAAGLGLASAYYFINVLGALSGSSGSTYRRKAFRRKRTVQNHLACCLTFGNGSCAREPRENRLFGMMSLCG